MPTPCIFQYRDYREYLQDYYKDKKASVDGFSIRSFAKKAGLGSSNYLKLVMDGQRALTVDMIHRFAKALELERNELEFFEALVHFNQVKTSEAREFYRLKIDQYAEKSPQAAFRLPTHKCFSESGFFPFILLAAHGEPVTGLVETVQEKLGLDRSEIDEVLGWLLNEEILTVNARYCQVNGSHFIFHDRLPTIKQRKMLAEQLRLSMRALQKHRKDRARFFSNSLTMESGKFEASVDDVKKFVAGLIAKYDCDKPESIIQLNLQLFEVDRELLTNR